QIVNGIIKNYQPLKDAERVLPPGVGDLDVLEFDTITTNIFILNNSIFVPSTTISSNKLEASALGMKEINGKYSYHFIVYLSELFTGLNEKRVQKQKETGAETFNEDKRNIRDSRIRYASDKSIPVIDSPEKRKATIRELRSSEVLLKLIFHPYVINYKTGVD
ncbi:MAG: hypothetical protein MI922_23140, partial [Bacteroidales bacterium]|nr:hypothetical protein [Bacteroidales bacterium]